MARQLTERDFYDEVIGVLDRLSRADLGRTKSSHELRMIHNALNSVFLAISNKSERVTPRTFYDAVMAHKAFWLSELPNSLAQHLDTPLGPNFHNGLDKHGFEHSMNTIADNVAGLMEQKPVLRMPEDDYYVAIGSKLKQLAIIVQQNPGWDNNRSILLKNALEALSVEMTQQNPDKKRINNAIRAHWPLWKDILPSELVKTIDNFGMEFSQPLDDGIFRAYLEGFNEDVQLSLASPLLAKLPQQAPNPVHPQPIPVNNQAVPPRPPQDPMSEAEYFGAIENVLFFIDLRKGPQDELPRLKAALEALSGAHDRQSINVAIVKNWDVWRELLTPDQRHRIEASSLIFPQSVDNQQFAQYLQNFGQITQNLLNDPLLANILPQAANPNPAPPNPVPPNPVPPNPVPPNPVPPNPVPPNPVPPNPVPPQPPAPDDHPRQVEFLRQLGIQGISIAAGSTLLNDPNQFDTYCNNNGFRQPENRHMVRAKIEEQWLLAHIREDALAAPSPLRTKLLGLINEPKEKAFKKTLREFAVTCNGGQGQPDDFFQNMDQHLPATLRMAMIERLIKESSNKDQLSAIAKAKDNQLAASLLPLGIKNSGWMDAAQKAQVKGWCEDRRDDLENVAQKNKDQVEKNKKVANRAALLDVVREFLQEPTNARTYSDGQKHNLLNIFDLLSSEHQQLILDRLNAQDNKFLQRVFQATSTEALRHYLDLKEDNLQVVEADLQKLVDVNKQAKALNNADLHYYLRAAYPNLNADSIDRINEALDVYYTNMSHISGAPNFVANAQAAYVRFCNQVQANTIVNFNIPPLSAQPIQRVLENSATIRGVLRQDFSSNPKLCSYLLAQPDLSTILRVPPLAAPAPAPAAPVPAAPVPAAPPLPPRTGISDRLATIAEHLNNADSLEQLQQNLRGENSPYTPLFKNMQESDFVALKAESRRNALVDSAPEDGTPDAVKDRDREVILSADKRNILNPLRTKFKEKQAAVKEMLATPLKDYVEVGLRSAALRFQTGDGAKLKTELQNLVQSTQDMERSLQADKAALQEYRASLTDSLVPNQPDYQQKLRKEKRYAEAYTLAANDPRMQQQLKTVDRYIAEADAAIAEVHKFREDNSLLDKVEAGAEQEKSALASMEYIERKASKEKLIRYPYSTGRGEVKIEAISPQANGSFQVQDADYRTPIANNAALGVQDNDGLAFLDKEKYLPKLGEGQAYKIKVPYYDDPTTSQTHNIVLVKEVNIKKNGKQSAKVTNNTPPPADLDSEQGKEYRLRSAMSACEALMESRKPNTVVKISSKNEQMAADLYVLLRLSGVPHELIKFEACVYDAKNDIKSTSSNILWNISAALWKGENDYRSGSPAQSAYDLFHNEGKEQMQYFVETKKSWYNITDKTANEEREAKSFKAFKDTNESMRKATDNSSDSEYRPVTPTPKPPGMN